MPVSFPAPVPGGSEDGERLTPGFRLHPLFVFALLFTLVFLLHAPLLRLPYFWDEAGYYVPAARDLLLTGSLIPGSTASNAHPPLVMGWLALWWKLSGYTPAVTRTAMLLVAAFGLLGVFRLSKQVSNLAVATAATLATALYPVFFAQSSLAQVDLAAAAFSLWGISLVIERRRTWSIAAFCLAVLSKETAIIVPAGIGCWELWWTLRRRESRFAPPATHARESCVLMLVPLLTLAGWFAFHYSRTGYIFGNPEYFRYNVSATLNPLRFVLAILRRLWHVLGYMNMFLLTVAAGMAMTFPARVDRRTGEPRPRIALGAQALFAVVIAAQVLCFSVVGGAPLARYLLTSIPLVIILGVSTIWRRMREWVLVMAVVGGGFVLAWFVNPPYPFSLEDNLAYRDYVLLHKRAAELLAVHDPRARVLTAWPATDELSRPYLGYSKLVFRVLPVENFSAPELLAARGDSSRYDVALLFSTKYEPSHNFFALFPRWQQWQMRFFGYHHDVPPEAAAQILGGRVFFLDQRNGQWVAIVSVERPEYARSLAR